MDKIAKREDDISIIGKEGAEEEVIHTLICVWRVGALDIAAGMEKAVWCGCGRQQWRAHLTKFPGL